MLDRRHFSFVTVAFANKMARIIPSFCVPGWSRCASFRLQVRSVRQGFQSFSQPTLARSRPKMSCPAGTDTIRYRPETPAFCSAGAGTAGTMEEAQCRPLGVWSQ